MSTAAQSVSGPAGMQTTVDALRWALKRIEGSNLGQGDYFERAVDLLQKAEQKADDCCPACAGSGIVRAMTAHLGPDDYEYDDQCAYCAGSGAADLKEVIESLGYFERQHFSGAAPTPYVRRSEVLKVIAARAALAKVSP